MKPSSCKAKGRKACVEVRDLLLKYAPDLLPDDIRITPSGVPGDDLLLSPAAQKIYPLSVECKNVEKLTIWGALAQGEVRVDPEDEKAFRKVPILFSCYLTNLSAIIWKIRNCIIGFNLLLYG